MLLLHTYFDQAYFHVNCYTHKRHITLLSQECEVTDNFNRRNTSATAYTTEVNYCTSFFFLLLSVAS
jgi:hypothetical protein